MADLDLESCERDSRWMPHLSWSYPDMILQQRMEIKAAQRERAWQKMADKLGPLLAGTSFNHYISNDLDETHQEYLERAYEKSPLLSSSTNTSHHHSIKQHSTSGKISRPEAKTKERQVKKR